MLFEYEGEDGGFYISARKPDERGSEVTLLHAQTIDEFHRLKRQGFGVESGSQADFIMRRLVRTGAAQLVTQLAELEGRGSAAEFELKPSLDPFRP
jgi:hypothetical protein